MDLNSSIDLSDDKEDSVSTNSSSTTSSLIKPCRSSSYVWEYFTLKEINTKQVAVCKFCKDRLSYCGSTTTLQYHLKNKHSM